MCVPYDKVSTALLNIPPQDDTGSSLMANMFWMLHVGGMLQKSRHRGKAY